MCIFKEKLRQYKSNGFGKIEPKRILQVLSFVFQVSNEQYFKYKQRLKRSRGMTPQEYEKFKIGLKETQEKMARTLARIDQTLIGVKETIGQINENNQNIEKFQKRYGEVMTQLAQKLAASFANPFKKVEGKVYEHLPQQIPFKSLVECMLKNEDILIITGAGVSAPSGIPTFRGKNGLYDKKFQWEGKEYEPEQFITKNFYDQNPKPIWDWIEAIYKMATTLKPNKIHTLIDKLASALKARKKNVTIVTQNVDDLHLKPKENGYNYYAIHGNVKLVRCDNLHLSSYEQYREEIKAGTQVKCPNCELFFRPHVLFFDESYGPLYGEEVKDKKFPFVFVIGSSLSTGLCSKFAQNAVQLVEINPEPVIEVGKVYQYKQETSLVLEKILKSMGELK